MNYKIILKKNNETVNINYTSELNEKDLREYFKKNKYIHIANTIFNILAWDSCEIRKE